MMKQLFEMPLAQSIVKSLSDNLSSLVLSFLGPMRNQYATNSRHANNAARGDDKYLHLCVHVREGNNETGDWQSKTWRHIDHSTILDRTLAGMMNFTATANNHTTSLAANDTTATKALSTAGNVVWSQIITKWRKSREQKKRKNNLPPKVSVFVASDNDKSRSWFEEHVPNNWHVVKPGKHIPKPQNGVWFGEHGSETNKNLTKDQLNEAMAEAVADVFALGECDGLWIPNYSSFSMIGIMLTRAERRKVFFLGKDEWVDLSI